MIAPQNEAVPSSAAIRSQPRHPFAFRGDPTALFALVLKNMLLTLLTLGIYLPWAKTERRRYIWQHIEIAGHRLRYHGNGKELFFGYLKVVAAYALFIAVPIAVTKLVSKAAGGITQLVMALLLLPLIPFAVWGARRYLLSRTSWRGIHFRLEGSASEFAKVFFGGYLLTLLTLGFYAPIWTNRMHRVMVDRTALGTCAFSYRGSDKEAFRLGIRGFFLTLLTFGIYLFWYQAALARFQIQNTWFDGAHGEIDLTGADLLKLALIQIFGLTLSLGLAFPWIATYSLSYVLGRMRFVGPIDFAHVYPSATQGSPTADGLADAMDVGLAV